MVARFPARRESKSLAPHCFAMQPAALSTIPRWHGPCSGPTARLKRLAGTISAGFLWAFLTRFNKRRWCHQHSPPTHIALQIRTPRHTQHSRKVARDSSTTGIPSNPWRPSTAGLEQPPDPQFLVGNRSAGGKAGMPQKAAYSQIRSPGVLPERHCLGTWRTSLQAWTPSTRGRERHGSRE